MLPPTSTHGDNTRLGETNIGTHAHNAHCDLTRPERSARDCSCNNTWLGEFITAGDTSCDGAQISDTIVDKQATTPDAEHYI